MFTGYQGLTNGCDSRAYEPEGLSLTVLFTTISGTLAALLARQADNGVFTHKTLVITHGMRVIPSQLLPEATGVWSFADTHKLHHPRSQWPKKSV